MCDCEDRDVPHWYRAVRVIAMDIGAVVCLSAFAIACLAAIVFPVLIVLGRI